jgi:hypothetical protein
VIVVLVKAIFAISLFSWGKRFIVSDKKNISDVVFSLYIYILAV